MRETHHIWSQANEDTGREERSVFYKATEPVGESTPGDSLKWKPSIHMPRWASRITLEITNVRVEQMQDISEEDAKAEGIVPIVCKHPNPVLPSACEDCRNTGYIDPPEQGFMELWNSLNEKRGFGWSKNPWVWVIEFKRIKQ